MLAGEAAVRLVSALGVNPQLVPDLAGQFGGRTLLCPVCHGDTKELRLKGRKTDWCASCGALFLPRGDLEAFVPGLDPVPVIDVGGGVSGGGRTALQPRAEGGLPGRPIPPAREAIQAFLGEQIVIGIKQVVEMGEVLLGFEGRNKYVINLGLIGSGYALEASTGVMAFIKRQILRSHRPLDVEVFDPHGNLTFRFTRPFFFFFSDLRVETADGTHIGTVHRRWSWTFAKVYDLCDERGRVFARVHSPFWRIWTFPLKDPKGREVAVIQKKWGGFLRESFTDADRFTVEFGEALRWPPEQRAVIFAAALSIDMDFFEENHKR